MKNKTFRSFIAAVTAVLLLSGCSTGGESSGNADSSDAPASSTETSSSMYSAALTRNLQPSRQMILRLRAV